ncbi:MAG: L-serine ammonia-lyase [Flavobacteriales bacterium]|nr:L-serine ammonia-lyase [Flavobacteriales bacterium]MCB9448082.1 L-serine ammonia-lyase [Flavobacteriales bacterium]
MEQISVFDMFKVGIGPSSSHTMGPWKACLRMLESLGERVGQVTEVKVHLFGSLAKTGKGHGTGRAIMLGLAGENPAEISADKAEKIVLQVRETKQLVLGGKLQLDFDPQHHILYHFDRQLPFHSNAMEFEVFLKDGGLLREVYYSIGGGFVVKEDETQQEQSIQLTYPVSSAADLLRFCKETGMSISDVVMANEKCWKSERDVKEGLIGIWNVMQECIYRGCHKTGKLPGGLDVHRRAYDLDELLIKGAHYDNLQEWKQQIAKGENTFRRTLNWVACFALAVNEENASFGRVVTAPTNGAAGVIPAVLMYYNIFCRNEGDDDIVRFLLTASEVGSIFKKGATISAAMGGCQAEIGVASAMAAAALCERFGGTPKQSLMAAEIAMEHHLGLTCDPIGGLVQVPCIERNTMGAMKAITACNIALYSDPGVAKISLDDVVTTMWETAQDMSTKYKETSEAGLASRIPVNLPEC